MSDTRTLTIRCKQKGCPVYVQIAIPVDARAPRYRVVHADPHTLQEWKDAPISGGLAWDKDTWA